MLSDYGKMVSYSEASLSRAFQEGGWKKSSRMGGLFDHALQSRLAHIRSDGTNATFPMQLDYLNMTHIKSYKFLSTLARAPRKKSATKESDSKPSPANDYYFREAKLIKTINKALYLTIGRERQNLGPNLDDHTLYNKKLNRFNITDLSTIASLDYIQAKASYYAAVFIPSFQEVKMSREYGLKGELRQLYGRQQFGFGALYGKTPLVNRLAIDLFTKISFFNFYLLQDNIFTHRIIDEQLSFNQHSHLLKFSYFPFHSLELHTSAEYAFREKPFFVEQITNTTTLPIKWCY